jgi:hypothetical protein
MDIELTSLADWSCMQDITHNAQGVCLIKPVIDSVSIFVEEVSNVLPISRCLPILGLYKCLSLHSYRDDSRPQMYVVHILTCTPFNFNLRSVPPHLPDHLEQQLTAPALGTFSASLRPNPST